MGVKTRRDVQGIFARRGTTPHLALLSDKEEVSMPTQPSPQSNPRPTPERETGEPEAVAVDAIRHVGPTLEAEGTFVPTGELPENRIEQEGLTEAGQSRTDATDEYDREAEAMGAEPLRTRLPGDQSSDPHTDVGPDNATTLDDDRADHAA